MQKHLSIGQYNIPRWHITLGITFLSQLLSAVGFSLIFPFLPLYIADLGSITGMSIEFLAGLVISAQGFTMMVASPIWGAVADRYGRKLMVLRSTLGGAGVLLLMAFVRNAEELILLRAIQGVITGTFSANNALVASEVPRERIGFAMGTLQVGLWAGIAVGPLLGGIMADAFGFAIPFIATAALLFFSGVLVWFGIDEEHTPVKREKSEQRSFIEEWRHVVTTPGVDVVFLMRFMITFGRMFIIPIAPLFVVALLSENVTNQNTYAGMVTAISSATATFSGVYLGRLGDRIGHRRILIGCAIVGVIVFVPQTFVSNIWQLLFLQGLAGIAAGGLITAPSALLARYTEHGEEGSVYGLDNSVISGARAAAPLGGALIATFFGLRGTFMATAIMFFLVTIVALRFLPQESKSEEAAAA